MNFLSYALYDTDKQTYLAVHTYLFAVESFKPHYMSRSTTMTTDGQKRRVMRRCLHKMATATATFLSFWCLFIYSALNFISFQFIFTRNLFSFLLPFPLRRKQTKKNVVHTYMYRERMLDEQQQQRKNATITIKSFYIHMHTLHTHTYIHCYIYK